MTLSSCQHSSPSIRSIRSQLTSRDIQHPILGIRSNIQIIQLQMHEMRVSMNTHIFQLRPVEIDASLAQPADSALVVGRMDAGLARQEELRDGGEVDELLRGALLLCAVALRGRRGAADDFGLEVAKPVYGRGVGEFCVC